MSKTYLLFLLSFLFIACNDDNEGEEIPKSIKLSGTITYKSDGGFVPDVNATMYIFSNLTDITNYSYLGNGIYQHNIDGSKISSNLVSKVDENGVVIFDFKTEQKLLVVWESGNYKGKYDFKIVDLTFQNGNIDLGITKFTEDYPTYYISIPSTNNKRIASWGDSLTMGAFGEGKTILTELATLLGNDFIYDNCGVGGETTATIGARQGGIPAITRNDIQLPASVTEINIGNGLDETTPFVSTHNNNPIKLLFQSTSDQVNVCSINGIECILRHAGNPANASYPTDPNAGYWLKRITAGEALTIPKGSLLITNKSNLNKNNFLNIYWIGTNGTYTSNKDLVDQIKLMTLYGKSEYIVIGLHSVSENSPLTTLESRKQLENMCIQEFGYRYINLREYLITNALRDADIAPTTEDNVAIAQGKCPTSLLVDAVHFKPIVNTLIGKLVYERLVKIGL